MEGGVTVTVEAVIWDENTAWIGGSIYKLDLSWLDRVLDNSHVYAMP
jgi:hypothetical protein